MVSGTLALPVFYWLCGCEAGQRTRRGRCPVEHRREFPPIRPSVHPSVRSFVRPSIHLQLISFDCCIYNGISHVWLGSSGDAKTHRQTPEKQMWNKLIDQPSNQWTYWQTDGWTETGTQTGISHRGWARAVMWRVGAVVCAIITMASVMCDRAGVVMWKLITKDITWSAVPLPCLCFLVQSVHPPNSLSEHPSTIHPTILPSIRLNHHSSLQ